MHEQDFVAQDGLALARLLEAGQVTASELMDCAIGLAEQVHRRLNILCYPRFDAAREAAAGARPHGTFGALPFLLKDTGLASTALQGSVGSRLFAGMRSSVDAHLTTRFLAAGFLPFARTTVPEFCMAPTTEAVQNGGPTRNPWDPELSAGGSSGGAAVAVATGVVPIAHGSDGGGSIRIPASCCGVFGLKPSRGLVPFGPQRGEGWAGLASDGVLSRTVRDTAAALDAIAGMDLGAPYAAPPRPASYLAELPRPFDRPLRIARWSSAFDDIALAPECLAAVDAATRALDDLGHEVIEAPLPDLGFARFLDAMIDIMAASVTLTVNGYLRAHPEIDPAQALEPAIFDALEQGKRISAETYGLAINRFHSIGRKLAIYLSDYDFILTPTLTQLPARLGEISMADDFRSFRRKVGRYTTFLAIINASGQPAASVPLHWTASGIPVGIQLVGRFGDESGVLRLSAQLESLAPWVGRLPARAGGVARNEDIDVLVR
ncbi:amidase [Angulomicrobium tetraedrale]|uniref:Indoleacetamide hydrolase n=1 Tax=Ancylobacter tetraedralis TaxID=217068 RepID=A0A839ZF69_9HYPH|nr:amidase [Ancylobacter tetraedralis]MBB3773419.1 amidase [Ancylobacter tetraedralis]